MLRVMALIGSEYSESLNRIDLVKKVRVGQPSETDSKHRNARIGAENYFLPVGIWLSKQAGFALENPDSRRVHR